ncbi:MAG TPA: hypothetical protein VF041_01240 [Gemmatimonadaceae bacterium]
MRVRATVVLPGTETVQRLVEPYPRPDVLESFAPAIVSLVAMVGNGQSVTVTIDDNCQWSSANPRVADILNGFFGPGYRARPMYSPNPRAVDLALDVAYYLGGQADIHWTSAELGAATRPASPDIVY